MLRLKTDLTKINRFDVEASDNLINSGNGYNGTWVVKNGDKLELPEDGDVHAMQVWTESYRDGTGKFTPDVSASGLDQLTVLQGKYRAVTDQYDGTPAAGALLKVNTDGKLVETTKASGDAVAVCTKAAFAETHLQEDHTVIEYLTL